MTFEEQAAELHRLEAAALSLGLSETAFERIAKAVSAQTDMTPEEMLAEIRHRVYAADRPRGARWGEKLG